MATGLDDKPLIDVLAEDTLTREPRATRIKVKDLPPSAKGTGKAMPKPTPTYSKGKIAEGLLPYYGFAAIGLMAVRPRAAQAIAENAEECARTLDEWAESNPAVRRFLTGFITKGKAAAVITAHAPIAFALVPESVVERVGDFMGRFFNTGESENDAPDY